MKHTTPVFARTAGLMVLLAAVPAAFAQSPSPTPGPTPGTAAPAPADTSPEQTSYLFGLTFGEQMHAVGIGPQVSPDAIERGIKDGLQGRKSTRAEQQQIQTFVQSIMAEALEHNRAAAKDFLAKNGQEKAVKTTADGLQYKVIAAGDAKAPAVSPSDEVTVNYRGKLLDGTEFDSSYTRGTPATFKVNGVIKGWQEALVLMKPGAKWTLFVPPELAYDTSPRPGIPAGSLLTFDVELLSVKPNISPEGAIPAPGQGEVKATSHRAMPPQKTAAPAEQ